LSRPNSKKHSGNKIEIKIEITYAFSNRIPVWENGRSVIRRITGWRLRLPRADVALARSVNCLLCEVAASFLLFI